jgi:hypothetical protein
MGRMANLRWEEYTLRPRPTHDPLGGMYAKPDPCGLPYFNTQGGWQTYGASASARPRRNPLWPPRSGQATSR